MATTFYATYSQASAGGLPVSATQGTTPWIVAGQGTAGAAATGVVTVQGIAGGTAIPISGSITATNPSVSATGAAVPADATMIGGSDGTDLRALACTAAGILEVIGSGTAGTAAAGVVTVQGVASMTPVQVSQATASNLNATVVGSGSAGTANAGVVTVQGIASMTPLLVNGSGSTQPVSGTVAVSNFPATVDVNAGAVSASTPRSVDGGRSLTTVLANNAYASTNVTTSAYVELIHSTSVALTRVAIWNTSGSIIKLATGAAASEVDKIYIGPGGTGVFDIAIPASTRISLEALDQTANAGYFLFTGFQ